MAEASDSMELNAYTEVCNYLRATMITKPTADDAAAEKK
jgi:hypothetical protein